MDMHKLAQDWMKVERELQAWRDIRAYWRQHQYYANRFGFTFETMIAEIKIEEAEAMISVLAQAKADIADAIDAAMEYPVRIAA